ncbi:Hypothetical protein AA314_09081 [Archangium gephyra]|uniref:Uncharacterized protein n=1 Tax=Archangium gephyra TaxID=48 RepID=A0AAC8TJ27_9BACT|nr:Hypothetical protein AA314_09081 [Archangium gephyra]
MHQYSGVGDESGRSLSLADTASQVAAPLAHGLAVPWV